MNAIKIAGLALMFAALGCSGASTRLTDGTYEITTETDEFTQFRHSTVVLPLNAERLVHNRRLRLAFVSDGRGTDVHMTIIRSGPRWSYLRCHHVRLLADNWRWAPESKHDGRVSRSVDGGPSVLEFISFSLDVGSVRALGEADVAKIRICNDVDELTDDMKATMLKLIDLDPSPVKCLPNQRDYDECLERGGVDPTLIGK